MTYQVNMHKLKDRYIEIYFLRNDNNERISGYWGISLWEKGETESFRNYMVSEFLDSMIVDVKESDCREEDIIVNYQDGELITYLNLESVPVGELFTLAVLFSQDCLTPTHSDSPSFPDIEI